MALIDILMPVRNAAPFLAESVGSVLAQSFTDWRLIAVDDRSNDNTWRILCDFGTRDERILPLKNEGSGIVRALNTALAHSRAPFLARMDADDISKTHRLGKLLTRMDREPAAGVAGSRVTVFPPERVTSNMGRYLSWQNSLLTEDQLRRERYVESTLTHATAMFHRQILMKAGGWREGAFPEDLDLWLRLHRAGVTFTKHPEVLYLWREHRARETRTSDRCSPEAFHRCKITHLSAELQERGIARTTIVGPVETVGRWGRSMEDEGFEVNTLPWSPVKPVPEEASGADFILAAFGVPEVRRKAREKLKTVGDEEDKWLFVG